MSKITFKANELIRDLGITYPFNPTEVCQLISSNASSVSYKEIPFEDKEKFLGITIIQGASTTICVNSSIPNTARRLFTAAHEIGHFVLHSQLNAKFKCTFEEINNHGSQKISSIEAEANEFASALLLPQLEIQDKIHRQDITWQLIKKIAEQYQTSLEATARRLITLTRDTCALIIHDANIMWTPIRSRKFQHFIPTTKLSTDLEKFESIEDSMILKCDAKDWGISSSSPLECRYSILNQEDLNKTMSLIYIEEMEEMD